MSRKERPVQVCTQPAALTAAESLRQLEELFSLHHDPQFGGTWPRKVQALLCFFYNARVL